MWAMKGFKMFTNKSLLMAVLLCASVAAPWSVSAAVPPKGGPSIPPPRALGTPPALWVAGGDGLVVFGAGTSLHVSDIETPGRILATLDLGAPVAGAAVVGRYAYLAQDGLGLRILDLVVPAQPADLGLIPFQGSEFRVTQWGDYLLVASDVSLTVLALGTRHSHTMDGAGGGHCMAMVDPFALGEVSSLGLDGVPTAISASGTLAFVATRDGFLTTIDLSDRTSPKLVGTRELPVPATALAAHLDGVAVGVAGAVATRSSSEESVGGPVIGGAKGLATAGRLILIAAGERGLFVTRDESALAATVNVNVGNFSFNPSVANINQGDTIHWVWTSGTHTSTSGTCASGNCTPNGLWDSGERTGATFNHTFPDAGTFPYFCTIHGASMTGRVTVQATGPTPLSATVAASPDSGDVPLTVSFTGTAAGGTPPYTYSWAFGDGSSSTDQNPSHTYAAIGTYTAVLTVTDAVQATAQSAGKTITVHVHTTNPPVITLIKKASPPFTIVVTGSNLQNGIQVFINGVQWNGVLWKNVGKIKITGGTSLKAAVPKGVATQFRFENPDSGSATATFSW